MSFDFHISALSKLCRICGNRLRKRTEEQRPPLKCRDYTKEVFSVFGLSTWDDKPDVHPQCFCDKCGRKVRHYQAGTRTYSTCVDNQTREWFKHTRVSDCGICQLFSEQSRPGRPSKKVHGGSLHQQQQEKECLPFDLFEENIFTTSQKHITDSCLSLDIVGREEEHSVFTCPICLCILSSPSIQTRCEHYFCAKCFTKYFQHKQSSVAPCPVCKAIVNYNQVFESPRVLRIQLQNLVVVCDQCTQIGKFSQLYNHSCSTATQVSKKQIQILCETTTPSEQDDKILQAANLLRTEAINHARGTPIPFAIEQATDRWTWLKLQLGDKVASLKTGSRPAVIKQVSATSASEPKPQSSPHVDSSIPANKALAMMRDCHLAWDQFRKLRKYIDTSAIASERSMRKQQKQLLQDYIEGELVLLKFTSSKADAINGYEKKLAPFVKINKVSAMVIDYLDRLDRSHSLISHNGVIPDDEVWLKIGGDKGGTSFKMAFQIVNVNRPNSLKNTTTFAVFEGDDSLYNLQQTMPAVLEDIFDLTNQTWRGRTFRLFCFGDYAFLTKLYGICACNARYSCIYCLASNTERQHPLSRRGRSPQRTLASLHEQYLKFIKDGQQRHRAKEISYSVVSKPMLQIEPDHVIVPTLHISLGVFKKLFDLFEIDCHQLDETIVKERLEAEDDTSCTSFDHLVASEAARQLQIQQQILEKNREIERIEDRLPLNVLNNLDDHTVYDDLKNKLKQLRIDIAELERQAEHLELPFGTGPVTSSLDAVLNKHKVCRQAYHGKSFVGNHVHKCCQPEVIRDMTGQPRRAIVELRTEDLPLAACDRLERTAAKIGEKFYSIFLQFADVHQAINHANPVTQLDIDRTDTCIKIFLQSYRQTFPEASITPKLHLLEDHVVDQLKSFRVGLGLLNEQGGELLHTEFNRAGRAVHGMRDELEKLKSIMRRHLTTTFPEVQSEMK